MAAPPLTHLDTCQNGLRRLRRTWGWLCLVGISPRPGPGAWAHHNNEWHILIGTHGQGLSLPPRLPRDVGFVGRGEALRGPLVIVLLYRRRDPDMRTNHSPTQHVGSLVGSLQCTGNKMIDCSSLGRATGCAILFARIQDTNIASSCSPSLGVSREDGECRWQRVNIWCPFTSASTCGQKPRDISHLQPQRSA